MDWDDTRANVGIARIIEDERLSKLTPSQLLKEKELHLKNELLYKKIDLKVINQEIKLIENKLKRLK